jgi:hypothetical protein
MLVSAPMHRVFLLSPANAAGVRARMLASDRAEFDLARRLRAPEGVALGEAFSFMSGLYFRGKWTYARRFAAAPDGMAGAQVITPNRGLFPADERITRDGLLALAESRIHEDHEAYRRPLECAARALSMLGPDLDVVLLGSIATGKYVTPLLDALPGLRFPLAFVGRGDMSRGGLLLRRAEAGEELEYGPVAGAVRHGPRPPRLDRRAPRRAPVEHP